MLRLVFTIVSNQNEKLMFLTEISFSWHKFDSHNVTVYEKILNSLCDTAIPVRRSAELL